MSIMLSLHVIIVSLIYTGFAAMWKLLKQTATSLSALIIPLIYIGFAVRLCLLKQTATSLSAIIIPLIVSALPHGRNYWNMCGLADVYISLLYNITFIK